jgi:hypothetical protein
MWTFSGGRSLSRLSDALRAYRSLRNDRGDAPEGALGTPGVDPVPPSPTELAATMGADPPSIRAPIAEGVGVPLPAIAASSRVFREMSPVTASATGTRVFNLASEPKESPPDGQGECQEFDLEASPHGDLPDHGDLTRPTPPGAEHSGEYSRRGSFQRSSSSPALPSCPSARLKRSNGRPWRRIYA